MFRLPLLAVGAAILLSASEAQAHYSFKILEPVEIVTNPDIKHTAEMLVEVTFTNTFDQTVRWRTNDLPEFAICDAAGNYVDTFIVETTPQGDEKQIEPDQSSAILKPKESHTIKVKVWVRALAMEPGRVYTLSDILGDAEKAAFTPIVKDGREKLRARAYQQTIRIKYASEEHSATIFDVDATKKVAYALTILSEKVDKVDVIPLYYSNKDTSSLTLLYEGKALSGSVRRAENGIAVIAFSTEADVSPKLNPKPFPLAPDDFDYKKDSYIACGWNASLGVTAPCSATKSGVENGFSTYFATPKEGWRGSGYYGTSGQLAGICDYAGHAHDGRLGYYVGVKTIRKALKEINYTFTSDDVEKPKK